MGSQGYEVLLEWTFLISDFPWWGGGGALEEVEGLLLVGF